MFVDLQQKPSHPLVLAVLGPPFPLSAGFLPHQSSESRFQITSRPVFRFLLTMVGTPVGSCSNVVSGIADSALENDSEEKEIRRLFFRAEIDTTAPFGSVKEAVTRFGGGLGFSKPKHNKVVVETQPSEIADTDIAQVEREAAELEKELIMKEKDTLDVLKELEGTKIILEELKSKLQGMESSGRQKNDAYHSAATEATACVQEAPNEKEVPGAREEQQKLGSLSAYPSAAPGLVLLELKQAKLNLSRTTDDLADIRSSVEAYSEEIENERMELEKTRERLRLKSSEVACLELELDGARSKLKPGVRDGFQDWILAPGTGDVVRRCSSDSCKDISAELGSLNSEAEKFKKMAEAAMSEIELTKTGIKTAEIRLAAAKKVREAARATEAVALAEIDAFQKSKISSCISEQITDGVTLSYEEYSCLAGKARDAAEISRMRIADSMARVDRANLSERDILARVQDVMGEVKMSKKALEEALCRVEAANIAKIAVEEALRKWWRSEHCRERPSSFHNSTKFKNGCASNHRKGPQTFDEHGGITMICDASPPPELKPTLSIGQILSQKLLVAEELERARKKRVQRSTSFGQIFGKHNGFLSGKLERQEQGGSGGGGTKKFSAKRKKLGFARFSLLMAMQKKKKEKKKSAAAVAR